MTWAWLKEGKTPWDSVAITGMSCWKTFLLTWNLNWFPLNGGPYWKGRGRRRVKAKLYLGSAPIYALLGFLPLPVKCLDPLQWPHIIAFPFHELAKCSLPLMLIIYFIHSTPFNSTAFSFSNSYMCSSNWELNNLYQVLYCPRVSNHLIRKWKQKSRKLWAHILMLQSLKDVKQVLLKSLQILKTS